MRRLSSLAAFLAIVLAAPVAAGTIINVERRELPDGTATPMVISVDGNLVSISDGGDERMIFRGDRQQMLIVDDEEKSYMALDAAMMEGVAQQLDAAAKQIEAAIANLPADQQAMARRLMEQQERQQPQQQPQVQRPAAAARAEATLADTEQVSRTAEAGTRHGYPCTRYEVFEEGVKVRELWVTDWDNVEGHAELEAAMKSMDDFLDKLTASFGNLGGGGSQMGTANAALAWHGIPGMPVVTTDFENGTATEESVVKSIDASSIPSSTFEVPEDYREEKIGG